MSISKMIIYSSTLVAIIAGIAGYIAFGSFTELEQAIFKGEEWHAFLDQLRSTIITACISIFLIALICGQFIARLLTKSISNLANLANGIEEGNGNSEITSEKKLSSLENALRQSRTITQQKQQLEDLNHELQLKNDSLDSLVYRVSHDLKAPIINIQSLLGIMKGRICSDANPIVDQSLGMAEKATFKLQNTIKDLLEVARIEKRLQAEKEWLTISEIISGVMEDNQQQINQTGTIFEIDLSAKQIYFSKNNLSSILANLITNAIKYSSPDRTSKVKIHSKKQANNIVLVIEDNGIGMDLKKHEGNLFQMFKRFHDHVEGTGVGMYIVKKLIEENGGSIELESEVNVGTKLTICFKQPKTDPILKKKIDLADQT